MQAKGKFLALPVQLVRRGLRALKLDAALGSQVHPAPAPPDDPAPAPPDPLGAELQALQELASHAQWNRLEAQGLELLQAQPDRHDVMELVSYAFQQQGKLKNAFAWAAKAAAMAPSSWSAHFIAGISLSALGEDQRACEFLRTAADIAPADRQTLRELTGALARSEGLDVAAAEHSRRRRSTGGEPTVLIAPLMSVPEWTSRTQQPILDAGEVEQIPFTTPRVWGSPAEVRTTFAWSNKPYVAALENARVFSHSSIVLAADGTALNDTVRDPQFGKFVKLAYDSVVLAQESERVLVDLSEFVPREIEAGIALCGLASDAFGHWFPEFLPKLIFLRQHPDFSATPIIVDADMPASHFEHLKRLAPNPLVMLERGQSLLCKKLLVAPTPSFSPLELFANDIPVNQMPGLSLRAMRFVAGGTVQAQEPPPDRRLFLARRNMRWRRLLNEQEIIDVLSPLGFEPVYMEELSMQEQIALFRRAAWIVAPNGSALLNLVFCETGVKLLVLTQPGLFNWGTFQGPMDALGYHSLCVTGESAVTPDQKHSDYRISPDAVCNALASMGLDQPDKRPLT